MKKRFINKLILLIIAIISLCIIAGCKGKAEESKENISSAIFVTEEGTSENDKNNGSERDNTYSVPSEVENNSESVNSKADEEADDPDPTPDYVDDYEIEVQEDESVIIQ